MRRQPQLSKFGRDVDLEVLIEHFEKNQHLFRSIADSLVRDFGTAPDLQPNIHFIRSRVKSAESLRRKLRDLMKSREQAERPFDVNTSNLFRKINDLAGVRILHLHTEQIEEMNNSIMNVLDEKRYRIVEGPVSNCWDNEYRAFFQKIGLKTKMRESMYSSVHYVVEANQKTRITCEIQVRTLMDEVWGEVSHRVNYPEVSGSRSCQDQLKVLARITSAGTRLVDSIFRSHMEGRRRG